MPFRLHPSGYCVYFPDGVSLSNLVAGQKCPDCGRVAGHHVACPKFVLKNSGSSSRESLFNCAAVLWHCSPEKSFITFTLPSISDGVYQSHPLNSATGDKVVTEKFSKVLEALQVRFKRSGRKLLYLWVSEAQKERAEKFGGCGDLHFHLIVNQSYKDYARGWKDGKYWRYPFISAQSQSEIEWMQNLWCEHIGATSNNCVHVDPLPDGIDCIPSYLSKYLGKGVQRQIFSRRFAASRDLTKFKPVTLANLPDDCEFLRESRKEKDGYTLVANYFKTSDVLDNYGALMLDESKFYGGAKGSAVEWKERERYRANKKINQSMLPERVNVSLRPVKIGSATSAKTLREVRKLKKLIASRS